MWKTQEIWQLYGNVVHECFKSRFLHSYLDFFPENLGQMIEMMTSTYTICLKSIEKNFLPVTQCYLQRFKFHFGYKLY